MSSARFECPQCQFSFSAREAAYSDCPACGAMAIPSEEPTLSERPDSQERSVPSAEETDLAPASASTPGIFGGLFSEDPKSAEGPKIYERPASLAMTRDTHDNVVGDPGTFDEPTAAISDRDIDTFDPFANVPDVEEDVHRAATEVLDRNQTMDGVWEDSVEQDPFSDEDSFAPTHDELVRPEQEHLGLSADLFSDAEAPASHSPLVASQEGAPIASVEDQPPVQPSYEDVPVAPAPGSLAFSAPAPVEVPTESRPQEGFWDPNYTSDELQPGAVLLSALEAQMAGAQKLDLDEPFEGGGFDDANFDALEAAFDEAASRPDMIPVGRAQDALVAASAQLAMSSAALPMRAEDVARSMPSSAPNAPAALTGRANDLPHLSLSEETLALTGLPIVDAVATSTSGNLAMNLTRPPATARSSSSSSSSSLGIEAADPALSVETPAVPRMFSGFTPLRIAALVLAMLIMGVALGAVIAPKVERRQTPRAMAEQKYAEGNRLFETGKYDEALGSYRAAIVRDPTFERAYRAKAVALAKYPERQAEAADAYRKYLEVTSDPADKKLIEEILSRYDPEAKP